MTRFAAILGLLCVLSLVVTWGQTPPPPTSTVIPPATPSPTPDGLEVSDGPRFVPIHVPLNTLPAVAPRISLRTAAGAVVDSINGGQVLGVGDAVTFWPQATDPDGDRIAYTWLKRSSLPLTWTAGGGTPTLTFVVTQSMLDNRQPIEFWCLVNDGHDYDNLGRGWPGVRVKFKVQFPTPL